MTGGRGFFGHPPGLATLAFTEAWERFSFSGMQALLVLYIVDGLLTPGHVEAVLGLARLRGVLELAYGPLAPQPFSSALFGLYTGLIFLVPVLGGFLGDRVFGQHAMVTAGALLMVAGHFLMAFEPSFLLALLLLILGAGCLKGNISRQVGSLYADDDRRRADGFQIFSMATNVGVILAPLVCGTLGEVYGWHYGFGAAGVGMLIGLVTYLAGRRTLPPDLIVRREPGGARASLLPDRRQLLMLVAAFLATICFLVTAGQLGNVYGLWLKDHAARGVGTLTIPVTWFQSVTPLFSLVLTPMVIARWRRQAAAGGEPGLFAKMATGLAMAAAGMLLLSALAARGGAVPWWLLLPTHVLVCLGYVFVYPVGLALFSEVAPTAARATYIGLFFLSSVVASNIVGAIGGLYATMSPPAFWALQGAIGLGGMLPALAAVAATRGRRLTSGAKHV